MELEDGVRKIIIDYKLIYIMQIEILLWLYNLFYDELLHAYYKKRIEEILEQRISNERTITINIYYINGELCITHVFRAQKLERL